MFCFENKDRCSINIDTVYQGPVLSSHRHSLLDLKFSSEEIKLALWNIPDDKAPGLDGFNFRFYKASREVLGGGIVKAVTQFFDNGKMLKSWNTTTITLIPKVWCPTHPGDFRPISCCHVLYKCISKLICSKIKFVLEFLIDQAQGAFVVGRSIMHNILLCQDLVKHYTRKNCTPSCLMKIDLCKAYDTMNWQFIKEMLVALNFPHKFIKIIMACIISTSYVLMINALLLTFFL